MTNCSLKRSKQKLNSNRHSFLLSNGVVWLLKCIHNLSIIRFNTSGRGSDGNIVCRTKGSRHKFRIRLLCVKQRSFFASVPAVLLRIEYVPYRSASLGVLHFMNNICYYSVLTDGLNIGDTIHTYFYSVLLFDSKTTLSVVIRKGDTCDLYTMPIGTTLHSIELNPSSDKLYITSAGCFGMYLQKFKSLLIGMVRLPSGLISDFSLLCYATKGIVCNKDHRRRIIGQAGRNRRFGLKSIVRGVAKNPVDHPHGGGEGKKSPPSCRRTAWGKMLTWCKTSRRIVRKLRYV